MGLTCSREYKTRHRCPSVQPCTTIEEYADYRPLGLTIVRKILFVSALYKEETVHYLVYSVLILQQAYKRLLEMNHSTLIITNRNSIRIAYLLLTILLADIYRAWALLPEILVTLFTQ